MATLNELRTKGGVIVTAIIAIALVAFLLGDLFSSSSTSLNSRRTRVGVIDGKNIGYNEYADRTDAVKNVYQSLWGTTAFSNEQYDMVYDEAWNDMVFTNSYAPSFARMGLTVSPEEQVDMIRGEYLSPIVMSFFADPATGTFSPEYLRNFLSQVSTNPTAALLWNYIKERITQERLMDNYSKLVAAGFNATPTEVQRGVEAANTLSSISFVTKPFYAIPDSVVNAKVSSSAIKKYYNAHKEQFSRQPSRQIEYVVFDVTPSAEDNDNAKTAVAELAAEFAASDAPMQFASANSVEHPETVYKKRSDLSAAYAEISFGAKRGQLYGPVLEGDTYTIARMSDMRNMPDSIEARHILLEYGQTVLADSIVGALRKGADFAALAQKYSIDGSAAEGGKLGRFAPEQMIPEFSNALLAAGRNEIVTFESQYGIHIAQKTYSSPAVPKAQIAVITYKIDPSDKTIQIALNEANKLLVAADGSAEGFEKAVVEAGLSKRDARIRNTDRTVNGLTNPRVLIHWAYNNKKGDVSEVLDIDGDYVVAALKEVTDAGYAPVKEVATEIRRALVDDAKLAYIAQQVAGATTLDEVAQKLDVEVQTAADIAHNAVNVPGIGPETALVGAISVAPQGTISAPVKGNYGAYIFTVDSTSSADNATVESEKVRLDSYSLYYLNQRLNEAIQKGADITDNRVKFF